MRHMVLASSLIIAPGMALAAPSCAVSPAAGAPSAPPQVAQPQPTRQAPATEPGVALPLSLPAMTADEIAKSPALQRVASQGATLTDLGTDHSLRAIFARNGGAFQVFYLAPDGQALVGGVMWDATGHNITRDQVAPIPGTIPTVRIGTDPGGVPIQSPLKAVDATRYGVIGTASAPRLWMFIDPMCAFSVRAMQLLQPYVSAGKVQLAVIPLSVLDYEDQGRSTPAAEIMVSQPADRMVAAWTDQQLVGTPPASAPAILHTNMAAAAAIQLKGTPTFIWQRSDGSVGREDGIPNDVAGMIASIGH
jgi:thiol:disulfide interchange protein DsbG